MNTVTTPLELPTVAGTSIHWSTAKRIGFRIAFVYLVLFCLSNQIINCVFPIPKFDAPDPDTLTPFRAIIFWVAAHLFGAKLPLVYSDTGSGDTTYNWVTVFCILVTSIVAACIWSGVDRDRQSYPKLYGWFWLFLRFCLAGQMVTYGFVKAFPLQMPHPFLFQLTEPFGNFSPMGVLWASVGASPAYETFAGCAELTGGILLMFPRTATLGALISLADMAQVFTLNMTYDVPVKLLSFHLILLSLALLGPNLERLANFFILRRATEAAAPVGLPLVSTRAKRIAVAAQTVLWLWIIGNNLYGIWDAWHQYGPGLAKPALYGIWDVAQVTVDGQIRQAVLSDSDSWRRIIIDFPGSAQVEQWDDSRKGYDATVDEKKNSIVMSKPDDKKWQASFTYTRQAPDQLRLDGVYSGHKMQMTLKREDETKFLVNSRGFHWIQEYPFNR